MEVVHARSRRRDVEFYATPRHASSTSSIDYREFRLPQKVLSQGCSPAAAAIPALFDTTPVFFAL